MHRSAARSSLTAHLPMARDGLADEVDVDLCGVLLQFQEHLVDVPLRYELDDNLKLLHLDVDWIVVLAEEDLDLVLQDGRALLHDEVDVAQGHVLNLRLGVEERDEGRGQLARQPDALGVGPSPPGTPHDFHVGQDHLDGAHDHGRVGVLEAGRDALDDPLGLPSLRGGVLGKSCPG